MDQPNVDRRRRKWRRMMEFTPSASIIALTLSVLSFYRSYFYINQQLDVTVTEVSYGTNRGELYMTIAFSNGGNRDAAILRLEGGVWGRRPRSAKPGGVPIAKPVAPTIPLVAPHVPMVVKSGGVEVV